MTDWKGFLRRWLLIALGLHIVAAVFSAGFYHSDEHFQILEFVSFKLGWSRPEILPIEFSQAMRPWLQPTLYYAVVRSLGAFGVGDPFVWATAIRLVSALVGWLSLVMISLCCENWFADPGARKRAVRCLALLWFLPALQARHSSENLGGALFFLGFCGLIWADTRARASAWVWGAFGLVLGLAFECRYQTAFLSAGALLWLILVHRARAGQLARVALGFAAAVALGTLVDRWGYGHWVLAPWNYLRFNLLEHHLSDMDVSPWWDYLRRATTEAWPFLGTLTLLAFPVAWVRNPKHPLTWATVPFLLFHVLVGHKELRFLFPMLPAAAVMIALALERLAPSGAWLRTRSTAWRTLIVWNALALTALTLVPAWMPIRFYSHLYHEVTAGGRIPFTLRYVGLGPYQVPVELTFYKPRSLRLEGAPDYGALAAEVRSARETQWVFHTHAQLPQEAGELSSWCSAEYSVLPRWLRHLDLGGALDRVSNWTLYRCQAPNPDENS